MDIKERILLFISSQGLNKSKFEKTVGLSNGYINNIKGNLGYDKIEQILKTYPELNRNWLLTGEGEMLKRIEAVPLSPEDTRIMNVPLVSKYAYAGFLNGFGDDEYIEALPTVPFFVDHNAKGTYYAFEVRGDSMDDDSRDSIIEGDILFCREIEPLYWQQKKLHLRKWRYFVIVHRTEGILIKCVTKHDVDKGIITIHSLNPEYEDAELSLAEISGIYNVVKIERKPIS